MAPAALPRAAARTPRLPHGARRRSVNEGLELRDDRERDGLGRAAAERQSDRRVQPAAQLGASVPSRASSFSRRAAGPSRPT